MPRDRTRRHTRGGHLRLALALFLTTSTSGAYDPPESTSGVTACREFRAKNERELEAWSRTQPPVPYRYARPGTVLTAPWITFLDWFGGNLDLVAASAVPHPGVQIRGNTPASVLSWPWSFPIGPAYSCSRKVGTYDYVGHKAHRLMLEPGLVASAVGSGVFTRPGYRLLIHPAEWVVGIGGGVGSLIEIAGNKEPLRASISPEVLVHFGHCCDRSYFTLTARPEFFFAGQNRTLFMASLGYTYF